MVDVDSGVASWTQLLDSVPAPLVCADDQGIIRYVNARLLALLDFQAEDLVGHRASSALPLRQARDLFATGAARENDVDLSGPGGWPGIGSVGTVVVHGKDGSALTSPLTVTHLETPSGTLTLAAFGVATAGWAGSDALLTVFASRVPVAFALQSFEPPVYLYVSPAFVTMFGYYPQVGLEPTLIRPDVLLHIHPDDRDEVERQTRRRIGAGEELNLEYRLATDPDDVRWIHTTFFPIADDTEALTLVGGISEDITELRASEAALRVARDDVEKSRAEKQALLSRANLELRTPLNTVLGFAQLLQIDLPAGPQQESVDHILHAGRHLLDMVNDLLDISQANSDEIDATVEPIQLAASITDALRPMEPLAASAGVELRYGTRRVDLGRHVYADAERLSQVLRNVITNAINYNHQGGRVDIACSFADDPDTNTLQIAIADTGAGIAPIDLPRVFTPFDRLGMESSEIAGTGIGLAVARQLMLAMSGDITVSPEPGPGSTFTVTLPAAISEDRDGDKDESDLASNGATPGAREGVRTLLYAEDTEADIELMRRIVQRRPGWQLVHTTQGSAVFEIARTTLPSLVMLDLHLTDRPASEVIAQLRNDAVTADIPVILVSSDTTPPRPAQVRTLGATDLLTTPLQLSDIFALLDSY